MGAPTFFGREVAPGKTVPFVPPPEQTKLHLSQACLNPSAKAGDRAVLLVKSGDAGAPLAVCSLRQGGTECVGLDLIFDSYTEFTVQGKASVHLTGYHMPEYELGSGDEDGSDGEEGESDEEVDERALAYAAAAAGGDGRVPLGAIVGFDEDGMPVFDMDYSSGEDSDFDSEEGEEEGSESFDSEDEGDSDDGEDDEEAELDGITRRSRSDVRIEEIHEDGPATQAGRKAKALPAAQKLKAGAAPRGKAPATEDADVEASDEEDSDEEPAEAPAARVAAKQAAAKPAPKPAAKPAPKTEPHPQQPQQPQAQQPKLTAGQKRKADAAVAKAEQPLAKQSKQQAAAAVAAAAAEAGAKQRVRSFPNGFQIEELKQGPPEGKQAKPGKKVIVRYVGRLAASGKVFDQTQGGRTFSFRLGVGEVIKGWDRGVEGMRQGDKRRLTVPPQMAYGTGGVRGSIPPNAVLKFDVELVDVK